MRRAGPAEDGHVMRPAVAAVLFACLLLTLAATSTPRVVGDGAEYVHLAARLASGHLPGPGESRHFIFYPALAAPLLALGLTATAAFTILNGLLLAAALYVTASRLHWTWCAIVFAGPILWWLDKPHTEPFTFAMYAIAFALLESAPWWSLVAAGAAATQNPGNAALVGILAVAAVAGKASLLKDRRFWAGLAGGAVLAALHPVYYLVRLGTPTRLASTGDVHWVTLQEYVAVLVDPNIGLLPQVPVFAAAVLAGSLLLAFRAPRRLVSPGVVAAAASAAWLAFVAATATNVNHGGTPGLSRYATWFIPLAIPLFQAIDRVAGPPHHLDGAAGRRLCRPWRVGLSPGAARKPSIGRRASRRSCGPDIRRSTIRCRRSSRSVCAASTRTGCRSPPPAARRSSCPAGAGATASGRCPARLCQCPRGARWPARRATRTARRPGTSSSARACPCRRRSASRAAPRGRSRPSPFVAEALASLAWWNMSVRQVGDPDAIIQSSRHVGHVVIWQAANRFFAFAVDVQPDAELVVQVTQEMSVALTIESGPIEGTRVRLRPGLGRQAIRLPSPQPWVMLVAEAR